MKSEYERAKAIFLEALENQAPERWDDYVASACRQDRNLRARVEDLLKAHRSMRSFHEDAPASSAETVPPQSVAEEPGKMVGPYKLLQQIGEGGFGVVYMAEQQEPVRRKVALKVIKPGMDTKEVVARFEAERQALALMDHPHIARVFEAGATESGRPYFVMELVRGIPITEYADQNQLPIGERLEVFIQVCHAIHHAHQKGIIHRDIKPSNVLVTEHDGKPVPKVIDFGVAKALGDSLTDRTLFTGFHAILGTPLYMSPEQAALSAVAVDTRSDVYSLGVLLFELLTGTTPFDKERLRPLALDELRRVIREEDPPTPSARVKTLGPAAPMISANRGVDAEKLQRLLRSDLDWIVTKAMEKDRTQRYESTLDLARDIRRHLRHEPVHARPHSLVNVTLKYFRRHRAAIVVATALMFFLAIASAAGVLALQQRLWRLELELRLIDAATRSEKERWVREVAVPEIDRLVKNEDYFSAHEYAERTFANSDKHAIPPDLFEQTSTFVSFTTSPPGATVSIKRWNRPEDSWRIIGTTPLRNVRIPRGCLRWLVRRTGFLDSEFAVEVPHKATPMPETEPLYEMNLVAASEVPEGMVPIREEAADPHFGLFPGVDQFFIDRYEVTNEEFMEFVDAGGYSTQDYWEHPFVRDGNTITWEEAMSVFCDKTGQRGPATWHDGTYLPGRERFPVGGVSWYEAAAYAKYRGKCLPTIHHWIVAGGLLCGPQIAALSNFGQQGPSTVGTHKGIGLNPVYDLAGNVKEWCFNATTDGKHWIKGGAWNDPTYMYSLADAAAPLDRQLTFGFRCAVYPTPPSEQALAPRALFTTDYVNRMPASAEVVAAYQRQYLYSTHKPLNAKTVEDKDCEIDKIGVRRELIHIDTAYNDEKLPIYLYLPHDAPEPLQTVVIFPGAGGMWPNAKASEWEMPTHNFCTALLAQGRAICSPAYKGYFERVGDYEWNKGGTALRDYTIYMAKDLCRTLDYLRSRNDIDPERVAYLGFSYGAAFGPVMTNCGTRFCGAIFVSGGLCDSQSLFQEGIPPEVDPFNYLQCMTMPTLLLSNRHDAIFPRPFSQVPFVEGMASASKTWHEYDTIHGAFPMDETLQLIEEWCNEVMGKVTRIEPPAGKAAFP